MTRGADSKARRPGPAIVVSLLVVASSLGLPGVASPFGDASPRASSPGHSPSLSRSGIGRQGPADDGACVEPAAEVAIDHVVVAVEKLDSASTTVERMGFTLKDGRLHANGQRNRHIKLRSDEDVELMTVEGEGGDATARAYRDFLREGEGGAFLALTAPTQRVLEAAERMGAKPLHLEGPAFSYVTFPDDPALAAVFFIEYAVPPVDSDSVLAHDNGITDMVAVTLQDDGTVYALLRGLGGRPCPSSDPATPSGAVGVRGATIRLTPGRAERPRVLTLELAGPAVFSPTSILPSAAHGVRWILSPEGAP